MVEFTTVIQRFGKQGEKTGWTYIVIPADIAQKLKPGNKRGFRSKGKLDTYSFSGKSLLPMGKGEFILTIDSKIRKAIGKRHGEILKVQIEFDNSQYQLNKTFIECLNEAPQTLQFFKTLTRSHQNYFSKWIESAKTEETKAKRIAQALNAFDRMHGFAEMLRALKKERDF
jgi:Asp-tRNA(Asn)/Glu-tRNA(Gln) amidotransferase B subunit